MTCTAWILVSGSDTGIKVAAVSGTIVLMSLYPIHTLETQDAAVSGYYSVADPLPNSET